MASQAADLVRALGSASPAEQLEAARALEQLAAAPGDGAQRIQRAGGVPALLRLLQPGEGEELQIAAASALARMAAREPNMARDISAAGAGRVLAQCLPGSRSAALTQALVKLLAVLTPSREQQLFDELTSSCSFLQRLAQLAADPSQDSATQQMALVLLAGPMLATSSSAVAAAAAPHAAALVQRLSLPYNESSPLTWVAQMGAAKLMTLLAHNSAQLAASLVAAGALPRLVELLTSPFLDLQGAAVLALEGLVFGKPSAAALLAAVDGVAALLVQVLASHQPPASCRQAWEEAAEATSVQATVLLRELSNVDLALAGRAITAGALPQLTRVLRWGAQRLDWLGRQGRWEQEAETSCTYACGGLFQLLWRSGPSAVTPAVQAELPQLLQLVLQHSRSQYTLIAASRLLVLLRGPGNESRLAQVQGAAAVLRQLQHGGQPDRAAAIAAALSELTGEAQQQQAGRSGAGNAPVQASSSAAAQAGGRTGAVPAHCAACNALPPAGRKFQVCAGCRAVRYCSPACQKAAWRSGHKAACREKAGGAKGKA
jgi:hypothetical protein